MKRKRILKLRKKDDLAPAETEKFREMKLPLDAFPENERKENSFRLLKGESYRAMR